MSRSKKQSSRNFGQSFEALESRDFLTADLTGTVAALNNASLTIGSPASVTVNIENVGDASAKGAATVNLYARPSGAEGSGQDILLGTGKANVNLAAGADSDATFKVAVPVNAPTGDFHLVAVVDSTAKITDANRDNNTLVGEQAVTFNAPNFNLQSDIDSVKLASSIVQGTAAKGQIKVAVSNTGNVVPNVKINVAVYARLVGGETADVLVGTVTNQNISGLNANKPKVFTVNVTIPTSLPEGTYKFYAIADPATESAPRGSVTETNESDNQSELSDASLVSAPAFVDYSLSAFTTTLGATANTGSKGSASVTVINNGNVTAASAAKGTIVIYATAAGTITEDSELVASLNNQALNFKAGASKTFKVNLDLNSLSAGTVTFVARLEGVTGVTESNSGNNTRALASTTNITLVPGVLGTIGDVLSLVMTESGSSSAGYSEAGSFTTNRGITGLYTYTIGNALPVIGRIIILSFNAVIEGQGLQPTIVLTIKGSYANTLAGKTLTFSKSSGTYSFSGIVPEISFDEFQKGKFTAS